MAEVSESVVLELMCLAEDLSLVRDLGSLEHWRAAYRESSLLDGNRIIRSWSDTDLAHRIAQGLGALEALMNVARSRGLLG